MNEPAAQQAFLNGLFAAIDAKDTAGFLTHLTPTAEFRFGAAPPVAGRAAVGEAVDAFFSTIAGLSHEVTNVVARDGIIACEGSVTYTRHDGTTITLPFADVFDFEDGLIAGYRIYMEIGPLYAKA